MKLFAFKREKKIILCNTTEPIIEDDEGDTPIAKAIVLSCFVALFGVMLVIPYRPREIITYKLPGHYKTCYRLGDIKYYDKELDKVFIKEGYDFCEDTPFINTGKQILEGGCENTGCNFQDTPFSLQDDFEKLVGTRFFIR